MQLFYSCSFSSTYLQCNNLAATGEPFAAAMYDMMYFIMNVWRIIFANMNDYLATA